eukprot:1380854-Prymnesium_polylepis.1
MEQGAHTAQRFYADLEALQLYLCVETRLRGGQSKPVELWRARQRRSGRHGDVATTTSSSARGSAGRVAGCAPGCTAAAAAAAVGRWRQ